MWVRYPHYPRKNSISFLNVVTVGHAYLHYKPSNISGSTLIVGSVGNILGIYEFSTPIHKKIILDFLPTLPTFHSSPCPPRGFTFISNVGTAPTLPTFHDVRFLNVVSVGNCW